MDDILYYLGSELNIRKLDFDVDQLSTTSEKVHLQQDTTSRGLFLCANALSIRMKTDQTFTQKEVSVFRLYMAVSIAYGSVRSPMCYCPVCNELYNDKIMGTFIQCYTCKKFVHYVCAKLATNKQFQILAEKTIPHCTRYVNFKILLKF